MSNVKERELLMPMYIPTDDKIARAFKTVKY